MVRRPEVVRSLSGLSIVQVKIKKKKSLRVNRFDHGTHRGAEQPAKQETPKHEEVRKAIPKCHDVYLQGVPIMRGYPPPFLQQFMGNQGKAS